MARNDRRVAVPLLDELRQREAARGSVVVAVIIIVAPVSSSSDASIVTIIGFCLINRHHDARCC
jgi:hypothetical protein